MHWYLVHTNCFYEKKVKERLDREKFATFLPLVRHTPLFPGYLFVRTEMNATVYLKIVKIKGVTGVFCNEGKPVIIPDQEVDKMMGGSMTGGRVLPQLRPLPLPNIREAETIPSER